MAIKADNSNLPRATSDGNPPDAAPRFGQLLAESWQALGEEHLHQKSRSDVDRYIRLGWAGQCARLIGYRLLGVEPSNPPDLAATWRMSLGTMVHELLQEAVKKAFPGAEVEKIVGAESDELFGFPVSGRSDLFLATAEDQCMTCSGNGHTADEDWKDEPEACPTCGGSGEVGKRTVVEVKTVNGFGFKMMVGARGTPEGPRSGALYQAALNGRAHHADEVVVLCLSLECLSDRELDSLVKKQGGEPDSWRKFLAEWSYPMSALDEMVDRELLRLGKIVTMIDEHAMANENPLPPRSIPLEMPARARVDDPMTGNWSLVVDGNVMEAGKVWQCASYCDYRDQCAADGPS